MMRRRIIIDKKPEIKIKNNLIIGKKIAFIIPITSRKRDYRKVEDTDFYKIFYNSFIKTESLNYTFSFYLGYDDDDDFYCKNLQEMLNLDKRIRMIKVSGLKGKVGQIWSILARTAVNEKNDWLYQIGDDIEILDKNWEDEFIKRLISMDLIGVVGPNDINTNRKLLTQSFVHASHLFIFKTYYPPEINNWYIDDWITYVCDQYHFVEFRVKNSGGVPRYDIDNQKEKYEKIIENDRKIFLDIKEEFKNKKIRSFKSDFTKMLIHNNEVFIFSPLVNENYEFLISGDNIDLEIVSKIDYQNKNYSFQINDIVFHHKTNIITEDDLAQYFYEKNYGVLTRKFNNLNNFNSNFYCLTGTQNILNKFFESEFTKDFVLITIESDYFDLNPLWLENKRLLRWYTWNKPFEHLKLFSLPIGLNKNRHIKAFLNFKLTIKQDKLLLINFDHKTHVERGKVLKIAKKWNFATHSDKLPNNSIKQVNSLSENCKITVEETNYDYFNYISEFKFVISPRGTGIDCHRTWEALYAGVIPIVKTSSIDDLFVDLPVLIIENWEQINEDFLNKQYAIIKNKKHDLNKLNLDYWLRKIEGPKVNFITYGNSLFYNSRKRLIKEAKEFKYFDSCKDYSEHDLTESFKEKHKNILNKPRGGGYWIWKIDIIKQSLNLMMDGDILVYLDAGCKLNKDGGRRFEEYLSILKYSKYDILSFQMLNQIEKVWTTKELFNYFNIDINSPEANSGQYIGGVLLMKKGPHLQKILKEMTLLLDKDENLITDKYNKTQNSFFINNRHDQSVLSLLRKKYGSEVIVGDETFFKDFNSLEAKEFPIHACRLK